MVKSFYRYHLLASFSTVQFLAVLPTARLTMWIESMWSMGFIVLCPNPSVVNLRMIIQGCFCFF